MEEIIFADELTACPFCGGSLEPDTVGTGNEIEHPSVTCLECYSTFPFYKKPKPKVMDDDPEIPFLKKV